MSDGLTIYQELSSLYKEMESAIDDTIEAGDELARCESEYRLAKGKLTAELRSDGMPVSVIADIVKSDENVNMLMLKRDMAQVLYKACPEQVNIRKLRYRALTEALAREWGRPSNQ